MKRCPRCTIVVCFLASLAGCQHPGVKSLMTVAPKSDVELHYDTEYEEELIGKREPDRGSLLWDFKWRYKDSLAEPVAVVDWQEGISSTWNVLYATNRQMVQDVRPGRTQTYGNNWTVKPEYGSCLVNLPHRAPGEDAPKSSDSMSVFEKVAFWSKHEEVEPEEIGPTVQIDDPRPMDNREFFDQLLEQVNRSRQRDVLLFVHGFNVDYESALTRTAQIAADLPFNGAIVAYSWPSQGSPTEYKSDGKIVDASIGAFSEFLTELGGRLPSDVKINVVVHSMGNRLMMRSLARLPQSFAQPKRFNNIVFCAPDVAVSEFKEKVSYAVDYSESVTLYTCANDTALNLSYIVNGEVRAGAPGVPLVIDGVNTIECVAVDTSLMGHSYYGSNPVILRDLFQILKEDIPPEERDWLKKHTLPFGMGSYWIFQGYPVKLRWTWHFDDSDAVGRVKLVDF